MAYSVSWPPTLPQMPLDSYSETSGVLVIRTRPDAGPAKMRRRGQKADTLNVQYNLSTTQVATLRTFVQDTIKGTIRFGFPHPRTGQMVEARIVPQGDGEFFTTSYILPNYWQVSLQLEVLP